ncbi:UNVERIFIED_CONTAM: hypothetical protein NCL1_42447 [Trichonephila clavipes]
MSVLNSMENRCLSLSCDRHELSPLFCFKDNNKQKVFTPTLFCCEKNVFIGIASSDYVCMQFKYVKCFAKVVIRYLQSPFCIAYPELMKCIVSGARECDVESKPIVTTMLDLYALVCTNGTELSLDNRKHKYCITKKVAVDNYFCNQPMFKALAKLGNPDDTREYQGNHLKVSCR